MFISMYQSTTMCIAFVPMFIFPFILKWYYAHLNTFVQSYNIASEALNNFKKIHYMYKQMRTSLF